MPKPKHWKYDTRAVSGKTADHIFDVDDEDGTLIQVAYTGVVTRIVENNKSNPKETLFDTACNNDKNSNGDRHPDKENTFEYGLF